jgi:hypothetical protein
LEPPIPTQLFFEWDQNPVTTPIVIEPFFTLGARSFSFKVLIAETEQIRKNNGLPTDQQSVPFEKHE